MWVFKTMYTANDNIAFLLLLPWQKYSSVLFLIARFILSFFLISLIILVAWRTNNKTRFWHKVTLWWFTTMNIFADWLQSQFYGEAKKASNGKPNSEHLYQAPDQNFTNRFVLRTISPCLTLLAYQIGTGYKTHEYDTIDKQTGFVWNFIQRSFVN